MKVLSRFSHIHHMAIVTGIFFVLCLSSSSVAKPVKNGFDLENSIIPANKVFSGGPPRDGIPSIDVPKFVSSNRASFLKDEDRVMGVEIEGEARAYPISILNWHEIVNDQFKDKSVAVTYCPLCGSGIVYNADIKGKRHQFGVSGLLYNSDVLLYDRETETLWSQILSKAVSGSLVNSKLEVIPSSHTSWQAWKKKHPNTKVLSTDTGYSRDYSRSPYGNYDNDQTIYFPLSFRSKRYHPKERVLGIVINGKQKVYPFSELAKTKVEMIDDNFEGESLRIKFDIENRDGSIENAQGKAVTSMNTFWFAWYAFYPESLIYKVNNNKN